LKSDNCFNAEGRWPPRWADRRGPLGKVPFFEITRNQELETRNSTQWRGTPGTWVLGLGTDTDGGELGNVRHSQTGSRSRIGQEGT